MLPRSEDACFAAKDFFRIAGELGLTALDDIAGGNIRTGTVNSDPVRTVNTGQVKSNSLYFVLLPIASTVELMIGIFQTTYVVS